MKKIFFTILILTATLSFSQEITKVKTVLKNSEYGNTRLMVTPLAYDMHAKKPTDKYGVYALLVCYNYKGKKRALHQDLTNDFHKKGFKEIFLEMGATKSNISINEVRFYRRDLTPENNRPKKSDCY